MAFNNVPVNGWPQIKDLEKLDAIARAIENLPTFTSTDRDWMDEWEQKLPELPEDPETDGVKVLTATTTSGETVKSWENPESGGVDYSTTEQSTGIKWIDGKDVYKKVVMFENPLTIAANSWTTTGISSVGISQIISGILLSGAGSGSGFYATGMSISGGTSGNEIEVYNYRSQLSCDGIIIEYTKTV